MSAMLCSRVGSCLFFYFFRSELKLLTQQIGSCSFGRLCQHATFAHNYLLSTILS